MSEMLAYLAGINESRDKRLLSDGEIRLRGICRAAIIRLNNAKVTLVP